MAEDPPGTREPVQLYPNPASSAITLDNAGTAGKYIITDLNGRLAMQGTLQPGATKVNIATLRAGSYVVKINGDDGNSQTQMIVKE